MSKLWKDLAERFAQFLYLIIQNSLFDIRYSSPPFVPCKGNEIL